MVHFLFSVPKRKTRTNPSRRCKAESKVVCQAIVQNKDIKIKSCVIRLNKLSQNDIQQAVSKKMNDERTLGQSKRKSDVELFSTPKRCKGIAKKTPMRRGIQVNTLMPAFHRYELVWAYIRGFATWPGVIEEILPNGNIVSTFLETTLIRT